jgi:rare lipoprotein A
VHRNVFFAGSAQSNRALLIALAVIVALASAACGKRVKARVPVQPAVAVIGAIETGNASWYGDPYNGRSAASGEIYDMQQLTAAHRTLPFQTWVEVTNRLNGKQVVVRINDRGPFVDGRIIDLSLAAARAVDLVRTGVAPVRLRVVEAPAAVSTSPAAETYAVQAGAFADRRRAESLRDALPFPNVRIVPLEGVSMLWRVLVGSGLNMDAAAALAIRVKQVAGDSLVVRDR